MRTVIVGGIERPDWSRLALGVGLDAKTGEVVRFAVLDGLGVEVLSTVELRDLEVLNVAG